MNRLLGKYHFILFGMILLILTLFYWYLFPLLIIYIIYILKRSDVFVFVVVAMVLTFASFIQYHLPRLDYNEFKGVVVKAEEKKKTVLTTSGKVMLYTTIDLSLGDVIEVSAYEVDYDTELFSYSNYLMNQNVVAVLKASKVKRTNNIFVLEKIQAYFVSKNKELYPKGYEYINTFLLGYNELEEDLNTSSRSIGVSYLIAISGMHVTILLSILGFILDKIFYFETPKNVITVLFIIFYALITNFSISVVRALLMTLLSKIGPKILTSLDRFSITAMITLLIHPRYLFLTSFELSYIVSFVIIIFLSFHTEENKLKNAFKFTFFSFLSTLPIILHQNYEINFITIIVGPILSLFFEVLLFPSIILLLFIPPLGGLLQYVFIFFENIVSFFASVDFLKITFGSISIIGILFYYLLFIFLLVTEEKSIKQHLSRVSIVLFLMILYIRPYLNPYYVIKVYDVGQGDSILITYPYSTKTVLIDCYNNIDMYLKRDGIRRIDVMFITHGHDDHMNKVDSINVRDVYSSYYDKTTLLESYKKKRNVGLLKSEDTIKIGNLIFNILGPTEYSTNENDNSLVIQVKIEGYTYLFCGDMEEDEENLLIEKYKNSLKSDFLKAGHHGSITSSSEKFLYYVDPKYVLISVGKNNKYGLPNNQRLLSYENVYRTDVLKTITIKSMNERMKIITS